MRSEQFLGRVLPLPMRCIDNRSVNVERELETLHDGLSARTEIVRKSLASYPGLRIDLMAMAEGASILCPWTSGRMTLHCLEGFVRVALDRAEYSLSSGEVVVVDGRCLREIVAIDASALMATVILCSGGARVALEENAYLPPLQASAVAEARN